MAVVHRLRARRSEMDPELEMLHHGSVVGPASDRRPAATIGPPVTLAPNDFTHLHVHSEFSLLDGLGRITELVDAAAAQGMDSMAITDHGALYGAVAFYQAAKNKGIKPIIGVETYVARRSMTDEGGQGRQPALPPDPAGQGLPRLPEPVPARHRRPYRRLLLQAAHRPRAPGEVQRGPIGLSACLGGEVAKALEVEDWELARSVAGEYGEIFGKDGFFLELQDHGLPEQRRLNGSSCASRRRSACRSSSPTTSTTSAQDQSEAHDVLLCVGTGNNLDTPGRLKFETHEFYVKSAAQMGALFPDQHEAILNSRRIAEMTDIDAAARPAAHPAFPGPRRRHRRVVAPQGMPGRPRAPYGDGHAGAPGSGSTTSSA